MPFITDKAAEIHEEMSAILEEKNHCITNVADFVHMALVSLLPKL